MEFTPHAYQKYGIGRLVKDERVALFIDNLAEGALRFAVFNARLLSVLIDYLRQRKGAVWFYAPPRIKFPLRIDMAAPCAIPSGGVLAPMHGIEVERWADAVPEDVIRRCKENA